MNQGRPRPVKAAVTLKVMFDNGDSDEIEFGELDLTILGSGLTVQLSEDIQSDGRIVRASERHGAPVPGLILAIRAGLVPQGPEGVLYRQKETRRGQSVSGDVTSVAGPEGPGDRN